MPTDGRVTSLGTVASLLSTDLVMVVSPGNASSGINYQATVQQIAVFIGSSSLTANLNLLNVNGTANFTGVVNFLNGTANFTSVANFNATTNFVQINLNGTANVTGTLNHLAGMANFTAVANFNSTTNHFGVNNYSGTSNFTGAVNFLNGTTNFTSVANFNATVRLGNNSPIIYFGDTGNISAQYVANGTGGQHNFKAGTSTILLLQSANTAVNYFSMIAAAANGGPTFSPAGSDANIPLNLGASGTSSIDFYTNSFAQRQVTIQHVATAVVQLVLKGAITGASPDVSASTGTATLNGVNISYSAADTIKGRAYGSGAGTTADLTVGQLRVLGFMTYGTRTLTLNMNTTADQQIDLEIPPTTTRFSLRSFFFFEPSTAISTASGGVYTGAGKTGTAVIAASQAYTALTTNTSVTGGGMLIVNPTNINTVFYKSSDLSSSLLYFSLSTAQGVAATTKLTVQMILFD